MADKTSSIIVDGGSITPLNSIINAGIKVAAGEDPVDAAGSAAASFAGAKAGAAIGSVVPGIGNVIGGALGSVLGSGVYGLLADGGEVSKKAAKFGNGGLMDDFLKGPGTFTMHLMGKDTGDMNDAQKIASLAGDPIGAMFFAEGGEPAARVDMRPGGPVEGPGTETSDSIPAWLSDEEFVENAEAVRLSRRETQAVIDDWQKGIGGAKALLKKINDRGLEKRYGENGDGNDVRRRMKVGGLFNGGQLGIALGAGAQMFNQVRQQRLAGERQDQILAIEKEKAGREAEKFGIEMENARAEQAMNKELRTLRDSYQKKSLAPDAVADNSGGLETDEGKIASTQVAPIETGQDEGGKSQAPSAPALPDKPAQIQTPPIEARQGWQAAPVDASPAPSPHGQTAPAAVPRVETPQVEAAPTQNAREQVVPVPAAPAAAAPGKAASPQNGNDSSAGNGMPAKGYGMVPDPTNQLDLQLRAARIIFPNDPERAMKIQKQAVSDAAIHALMALENGDVRMFSKLYGIFPNGDKPQSIEFDKDNVIFTHADGRRGVAPRSGVVRNLHMLIDPEKAFASQSAEERMAVQQKNFDARLALQEERNQLAWEKLARQGTGGGSRSGGSRYAGANGTEETDWNRTFKDLNVFTDEMDASKRMEYLNIAPLFHATISRQPGMSPKQAEAQSARATLAYMTRRDQYAAAFKEDKGREPTQLEILNQVAPVMIDQATATPKRLMMYDPADPGKGSVLLGGPVANGAPSELHGPAMGVMIQQIIKGELDDSDRETWDRIVEGKAKGTPEQQAAYVARWGSAGLEKHVGSYIKIAPRQGNAAGGGGTRSTPAKPTTVRSPATEAHIGKDPESERWAGLGRVRDSVSGAWDSATSYSRSQLDEWNKVRDETGCNQLIAMMRSKSIDAEQAARLLEILGRRSDLTGKHGVTPEELAALKQAAGA